MIPPHECVHGKPQNVCPANLHKTAPSCTAAANARNRPVPPARGERTCCTASVSTVAAPASPHGLGRGPLQVSQKRTTVKGGVSPWARQVSAGLLHADSQIRQASRRNGAVTPEAVWAADRAQQPGHRRRVHTLHHGLCEVAGEQGCGTMVSARTRVSRGADIPLRSLRGRG